MIVQNSTGNGWLSASFLTPPSSAPSSNTQSGLGSILQRWISSLFSPFLGSSTLFNIDGTPVVYKICKLGCTDPLANGDNLGNGRYDPEATTDDGSCIISGCMDPSALNYDPKANYENGTCYYDERTTQTYTCPDSDALNYEENDGSDPNKIADEKVCKYCEPEKITKYNDMIKNGK